MGTPSLLDGLLFAARSGGRLTLGLAALGILAGGAACKKKGATTQPTPTVTAVSVTGSAPNVGTTAQLAATASLSNGTTENVGSTATWRTSNASIATVGATGVVAGVAPGVVDISATYQSVTGTLRLTLSTPGPSVTGVSISGSAPPVGATAQMSASASLSDGSSRSVTSLATWRSSNTGIATVNTTGLVTGISPGAVDLTATYENVVGTLRITISSPVVLSGTYTGTATDSTGPGTMSWSVSQSGATVSGSVKATSQSGLVEFVGTVSGTVTGSTLAFTITFPQGFISSSPTCSATVSGTASGVTSTAISGTYAGSNSCTGAISGGQLSLTKP